MITRMRVIAGAAAVSLVLLTHEIALPLNALAETPAAETNQLVGSWSLISRVTTKADGSVLVDPGLSGTPTGILVYDGSGHVAAQLSRPGRSMAMLPDECRDAQKVRGTSDTAQTVLGYDAYFGTYIVNAKDGIVIHHLESALFPGDIGKSIVRHFTLSGDTLKISFNTTLADRTPVTRTLVWKRLK